MAIKVTFKDHFPLKMVRDLCEAEFMGLCKVCKATEDPRVIFLYPSSHEYTALKLQLAELDSENALSFIEQGQVP